MKAVSKKSFRLKRWRKNTTKRYPSFATRAYPNVGIPADMEILSIFRLEPGISATGATAKLQRYPGAVQAMV